jgi:hypothetical protein
MRYHASLSCAGTPRPAPGEDRCNVATLARDPEIPKPPNPILPPALQAVREFLIDKYLWFIPAQIPATFPSFSNCTRPFSGPSHAPFLIPYPGLEINVNHSKQSPAAISNPQIRREYASRKRPEIHHPPGPIFHFQRSVYRLRSAILEVDRTPAFSPDWCFQSL